MILHGARFHVNLRENDVELSGQLDDDGQHLSDWLSNFFSLDVSIVENDETGFPDDLDAAGPTIVSTATLQTVAGWFPEMTLDEVRLRFRANIEVDGVEPFWEDRLFGLGPDPRPFRIGTVLFGGTNPCQRCVVPTRQPLTGAVARSDSHICSDSAEKPRCPRGQCESDLIISTGCVRIPACWNWEPGKFASATPWSWPTTQRPILTQFDVSPVIPRRSWLKYCHQIRFRLVSLGLRSDRLLTNKTWRSFFVQYMTIRTGVR